MLLFTFRETCWHVDISMGFCGHHHTHKQPIWREQSNIKWWNRFYSESVPSGLESFRSPVACLWGSTHSSGCLVLMLLIQWGSGGFSTVALPSHISLSLGEEPVNTVSLYRVFRGVLFFFQSYCKLSISLQILRTWGRSHVFKVAECCFKLEFEFAECNFKLDFNIFSTSSVHLAGDCLRVYLCA